MLGDRDVRRAIGLALDRRAMVRSTFGATAEVPFGPASPMLWIRRGAPAPARVNVAEARRLLAARGWADHDGDGTLDRNGSPLTLRMLLPITSAFRMQIAQQVQEQLRQIGIHVELEGVEFPLYNERRDAGPVRPGLRGDQPGPLAHRAGPELVVHRRETMSRGSATRWWIR